VPDTGHWRQEPGEIAACGADGNARTAGEFFTVVDKQRSARPSLKGDSGGQVDRGHDRGLDGGRQPAMHLLEMRGGEITSTETSRLAGARCAGRITSTRRGPLPGAYPAAGWACGERPADRRKPARDQAHHAAG